MKKSTIIKFVFVFALSLSFFHLQAQTTLYNATVIKMAKAGLDDDLIMDEIISSKVQFDFSADSLKALSEANVSRALIEHMKLVNSKQNQNTSTQENTTTAFIKEEKKPSAPTITKDTITIAKVPEQIAPVAKKPISKNSFESNSLVITTINYISPIQELVMFFDSEYQSLYKKISIWDKQLKDSLNKINQQKILVEKTEAELATKKNMDANAYDNNIDVLRNQLNKQRENYLTTKRNFENRRITLTTEIQLMNNNLIKNSSTKYSDVSKMIKKYDTTPAQGEQSKKTTINQAPIPTDLSHNIAALSQMLYYYRNQIQALNTLIIEWNNKALKIITEDAELKKQLALKENEYKTIKQDAKANKKKIQTIKSEISDIESKRKALKKQMNNDSNTLSKLIKDANGRVQNILKIRFADIISDINYCFQETL
jgi:hypothetical protein